MSIVPTKINYNYSLMQQNLSILKSFYPFLSIQIVGKSILSKNIYVIKLREWPKRSILFRFNTRKWMDNKHFTYEIYWRLLHII